MRFRFSGVLLRFVDYRKEVEIEAQTLGAAFEKLLQECPLLSRVVYDGQGKISRAHVLFLGGQQLKNPEPTLRLNDGDCVEVVTTIAGGSSAASAL